MYKRQIVCTVLSAIHAAWQLARIDGGRLAGAEGLHVMELIRERRIQLPSESVVEGEVGFDLPAILRE